MSTAGLGKRGARAAPPRSVKPWKLGRTMILLVGIDPCLSLGESSIAKEES
jgi:hypothetical protein